MLLTNKTYTLASLCSTQKENTIQYFLYYLLSILIDFSLILFVAKIRDFSQSLKEMRRDLEQKKQKARPNKVKKRPRMKFTSL